MSLRKRLPTALTLLLLLFLLIQFAPALVVFIFLQAVILVSLFEFYNLSQKKKLYPQRVLGIFWALLISLSFFYEKFPLNLALFIFFLLAAIYFLLAFNTIEKLMNFPASIAITFFGPLYLSFNLNHFYPLIVERGPVYLYFLFAIIFLGDTGAYFVGKLFGRRKMAPLASPHKTWEGAFGGIFSGCLGALAAQQLLLKDFGVGRALLCGLLVHAVAQLSDPLESLFKRAVGVKDSSHVLPGHGGFLDRVDSLILAAPFFYYFLKFFGQ